MKSIDQGILSNSVCFTFEPSDFAKKSLKYLTWCGHYYCTERYGMERDSYPYNLLLFVREGNMDVCYKKSREYHLKKGDVLLIDCQYPHYYHAHNGLEFLYIHFDGIGSHEIVNEFIQRNNSPVFSQLQSVIIGKEIFSCVDFYNHNNISTMFQQNYWIEQLLYHISCISLPKISEDSPTDQVIQYIQQHIGETILLKDLAKLVNLSEYYFAHIFKKQTGYAPVEYILKSRLEKARILLVYSQKSVSEIAYEVGYSSPSSFINIFTRKIGFSPRVYRVAEKGKLNVF